jgi:hypothetical protein
MSPKRSVLFSHPHEYSEKNNGEDKQGNPRFG